jgi:hypothetical protein
MYLLHWIKMRSEELGESGRRKFVVGRDGIKWRETKLSLLLALLFLQIFQAEVGRCEEEMKCICDGGCEHLRESDCPNGITLDVCACCFICARGENEPCGGALGTCAFGLRCQLSRTRDDNDTMPREGTCTRKIK